MKRFRKSIEQTILLDDAASPLATPFTIHSVDTRTLLLLWFIRCASDNPARSLFIPIYSIGEIEHMLLNVLTINKLFAHYAHRSLSLSGPLRRRQACGLPSINAASKCDIATCYAIDYARSSFLHNSWKKKLNRRGSETETNQSRLHKGRVGASAAATTTTYCYQKRNGRINVMR